MSHFSAVSLEKNSSRIVWAFIALHIICWTFLPALTQHNAPLDTVEGFVWGHEMQWGYYKHPPLQAWLLQLVTHIFGSSGFGYFGLSAVTAGIAFWAIYRTSRLFTTKAKALIATLLCEGIVYFNYLATEFNPNVLQLMTWALASYAFANAILRDKLKYWILLGVFFALGCYAKYSIALLAMGFGLFMLTQKEARGFLCSHKPYIAFGAFLILLLPHIVWLFEYNLMPFTYALSRSEQAKDLFQLFYFPIKFTASQFLDMLPMFIMGAFLLNSKAAPQRLPKLQARLLTVLAFAPLTLNFIISFFTGHKPLDMWGMPYLNFIPLWLVVFAPIELSEKNLNRFSIAWGGLFALGLCVFYFSIACAPAYGFKPMRGHFAGTELSRMMFDKWHAQTNAPLTYVISDAWVGGNVALYAPDINNRPHVFIDGNTSISPWIDIADVEAKGALVVWRNHEPKPAFLANKDVPVETIELPWQTVTKMPPTRIHWAIVKPKNDK